MKPIGLRILKLKPKSVARGHHPKWIERWNLIPARAGSLTNGP